MGTKRQKIVEGMQEKDRERRKRKKQPSPVKPTYKEEGEGFLRRTKPRDRIVGESRAAKGGGTEPLPSQQYKVDRRARKAAAANEGKKSTVGGGEQGVRTETPKHMKAPKKKGGEGMGFIKEAAKRTKGTKPAPHMVRHTKAPAKAKRAAASFTEKAGVAQDIGPWKPTDRKATKPKVSYKKRKKTPYHIPNRYDIRKKTVDDLVGMKKGGSVDTQWGGYNFKDGGRIPGIRPTRKGT